MVKLLVGLTTSSGPIAQAKNGWPFVYIGHVASNGRALVFVGLVASRGPTTLAEKLSKFCFCWSCNHGGLVVLIKDGPVLIFVGLFNI